MPFSRVCVYATCWLFLLSRRSRLADMLGLKSSDTLHQFLGFNCLAMVNLEHLSHLMEGQ